MGKQWKQQPTFFSWAPKSLQMVTAAMKLKDSCSLKGGEVAQSCPTLCDPVDCSPQGSSVHGIFQASILEWVAISFSNAGKWKVKVKPLRHVRLLATPMNCSLPGFSVYRIFQARVLEWRALAFSHIYATIPKKQRHYFADKGPSHQSYGFLSSHVWMWELGHKESWAQKNWCFWTVVLEKTKLNRCVKQIASGKLLYSTGNSLVLCDDLEGWEAGAWEGGSEGRIYVYI